MAALCVPRVATGLCKLQEAQGSYQSNISFFGSASSRVGGYNLHLPYGRGYKTTPKWGIKPPQPPFWPFLTPGVVLCHLGVVLSPLLHWWVYPPIGVVLSPYLVIGGGLSLVWGGFIPHFW